MEILPGGIYQLRGSRHDAFLSSLATIMIDMLLKEQAAFMKQLINALTYLVTSENFYS